MPSVCSTGINLSFCIACFQAERKTDGVLAAAKIIDVKDESELDDFMVEIDILSECKHKHVVGMYEAYYHENKLWVSNQVTMIYSRLLISCFLATQHHMVQVIKMSAEVTVLVIRQTFQFFH